ncbi:hypothetical protein ACIQZG_11985 [Lysinibacillus sp. NPDC096418]|uniref:hypothetical protein n=1 Tax=Lysinibacillus sp. NPDC096418 TaxID=3364138 RepID=UPI00381B4DD1
MVLLQERYSTNLPEFFHLLDVSYHSFNLERCDEKTFYISVELKYKANKVLCDFIYILDKPDMYGAISINEHYKQAVHFIKQQFNHSLKYTDELRLAHRFSKSTFFQRSFKQFASKYPRFMANKTT